MFGVLKPSKVPPIIPKSPDRVRAALKYFKSEMAQAVPMDFQNMNWLEKIIFYIPKRHYLAHGSVLWKYARSLVEQLPERERQHEMAEIACLLERVGLAEPPE